MFLLQGLHFWQFMLAEWCKNSFLPSPPKPLTQKRTEQNRVVNLHLLPLLQLFRTSSTCIIGSTFPLGGMKGGRYSLLLHATPYKLHTNQSIIDSEDTYKIYTILPFLFSTRTKTKTTVVFHRHWSTADFELRVLCSMPN